MNTLKIASLIGLLFYFIILIISVARDKKNTSVFDYFFAGRTLPFWALSITFIASWWGAGSALSTADLAFEDGLGAFWYYGVPVLIATFIMMIFAKAIRKVGYLTQGSMMQARYSKSVAKMLSFLILLFMTISSASQMVGIGDFLGNFLGISYEWAVLLGTTIVLVYSVLGGFRGVVLTDIIQFIFLTLSAGIIFFVAMYQSGGFSVIAHQAQVLNKDGFMHVLGGAKKYLAYVITFGSAWMIQANVWQRISATRTVSDARKMTVMSFIAYIPLYLIVVFTGMAGIVLYESLPPGGVVVAIMVDYLSPAVAALAFIGISSAIMSTMDSLVNTGAMTFTMDLYETDSEEKKLRAARISTFVIMLVGIIIALRIRSILIVSWLASDIITTGVFVPLIGGFIWRRGNDKGALSSMLVGFIFSFYNLLLSFGVKLPSFWQLQSAKQVLVGVILSLVVYIVVSLLTKPDYEKAEAFMKDAGVIVVV